MDGSPQRLIDFGKSVEFEDQSSLPQVDKATFHKTANLAQVLNRTQKRRMVLMTQNKSHLNLASHLRSTSIENLAKRAIDHAKLTNHYCNESKKTRQYSASTFQAKSHVTDKQT